MNVYSYGTHALLVELDSTAETTSLRARLEQDRLPGTIETMPGLRTVLLRFDPAAVSASALAGRLLDLAPLSTEATPEDVAAAPAPVHVRVAYDGPDLAAVAERAGMAVDALVTAHQAATYRVALIGMAPGFYFLSGGDPRLQPPRRATPRQEVPRGSLGLAGAFTGIYPKRGPGGWQLIGRVLDDLWHPTRVPASLLAPGAAVRFTAA